MARSQAFVQIKADALTLTRLIPEGRVSTYKSIGNYLSVVPRQVAYLLATLDGASKETLPWYRVVGDGGVLSRPKATSSSVSQAALLAAEGVLIHEGKIVNFEALFLDAAALGSDVIPHRHYLSAVSETPE
jgi:alkylated DNA nucleotide flippase Atl1